MSMTKRRFCWTPHRVYLVTSKNWSRQICSRLRNRRSVQASIGRSTWVDLMVWKAPIRSITTSSVSSSFFRLIHSASVSTPTYRSLCNMFCVR